MNFFKTVFTSSICSGDEYDVDTFAIGVRKYYDNIGTRKQLVQIMQ